MTGDIKQEYGWLAARFAKRRLHLRTCKRAAGFYLGTIDKDGAPFSRESDGYWPTREEADRALATRDWTQRLQL